MPVQTALESSPSVRLAPGPATRRPRSCGVLLHVSSLPSTYGIGDLGPDAHEFAATLAAAGLEYWQFLPLTPTSTFIGNSPYSSPSAFAGNPLFISPELLLQDGYVSQMDIENSIRQVMLLRQADPTLNNGRVNFTAVTAQREHLLDAAFHNLSGHDGVLWRDPANLPGYSKFLEQNDFWLEDYALFAAIKEAQGGASWQSWPEELKQRDPKALTAWRAAHSRDVARQKFVQFLFYGQWERLRARCKALGVRLVGDMPIYVTEDSADVWSHPGLFKLDEKGYPITVAGVPPDYFSETGQRWGNPVYNWSAMESRGFDWWIKRLEHNLRLADLVRLDHFRGFCAYWEIPAEEKTAVKGKWIPAPGRKLFAALREHFGPLPFIAENLGVITPDVTELMREFQLPGMSVLQFGFADAPGENDNAPFRCERKSVVYTGTHDNPTGKQWFREAPEREKRNFINYRGQDLDADYANEVLMRMALESQAELAILPMQDILRLDGWARMNTPSKPENNWSWRLKDKHGWLPPSLEPWQNRERQRERGHETGYERFQAGCGCAEGTTDTALATEERSGLPVPDVFGHVHFLCGLYGRLPKQTIQKLR